MSYAWIVWLILAAVFVGLEVLTPGFFLLWFGIGALVSALLALAVGQSHYGLVGLYKLVELQRMFFEV